MTNSINIVAYVDIVSGLWTRNLIVSILVLKMVKSFGCDIYHPCCMAMLLQMVDIGVACLFETEMPSCTKVSCEFSLFAFGRLTIFESSENVLLTFSCFVGLESCQQWSYWS